MSVAPGRDALGSFVECSSVELYEDPALDWRGSLHRAESGMLTQLKREREEGSQSTYDSDGATWVVADISDARLKRIARDYSVRTVESSIRQHESNMIEQRVKRRGGVAA